MQVTTRHGKRWRVSGADITVNVETDYASLADAKLVCEQVEGQRLGAVAARKDLTAKGASS